MINISNSLKQACNSDKITYREYVVLEGTTTQIDVMTEMYATAYKDTHFIGTFNMKYIKFTTSNDVQYRNKELTLYKEINGENFKVGDFIVTEIKDDDSNEEVTVTAYDYGLKFAQTYVSNLNYNSGDVTLYQVLQEICNNCDVVLKNESITNGGFIVDSNQFTEGQLYGDVVSAIAFISGNFATINNNNELELLFNTPTDEIIEDYVDLEDKRDTQPITSVSIGVSNIEGENVVLKDENLISQYGEHWLIINDVPFAYTQAKRQQLITAIFNKVKGFGYSAFRSEYAFKPYLQLGDLIQFRNKEGNLVNSIILRITSKYDNIILEAPSVTKASIEYQNPLDALDIAKRTEVIVDKQNQVIESVVSQTDEQNQKIAQITQTVEELNSKISDVADITTSNEDNDAQVEFEGINQSEPIRIVIRPIGENISYLYPSDNLYPSDELFSKVRTIRFENTKTNEVFNYELPADLLYYDSENYDEFILDYDGQSCVINKRVGYNADGTTYVLENEKTLEFEYPRINLTDGDYRISVLGYDTAYLFVRLMAQNIYTTQFATRAELNSEISQTAEEINLEVSKKVGKSEVISSINQSAEAITIQANRVNINGVINAINNNTTTTIDGDKITTGSITANQISSKTITADKVASDVITTNNFSAQKINADNITTGTLSANKINGGTITASAINLGSGTFTANTSGTIKATSGTIGGFSLDGSSGLTSSYATIRPNGNLFLYPNSGSARYVLSSAMTFNAQGGVVIASNSNANISAPSNNLDLKACSGGTAYLACMGYSDGSDERSAVSCANGVLNLRSDGTIYANGAAIGGSSSKNTKTNIIELSQEKKEELYGLVKDIPLYEYDYKPEYGKKVNYGFLIEDVEDTKLNDLLHIVKVNEDIKTYCSEDLTRLNLIMIKELMNKIETLENKIKELESDK